MAPMLEKFAAEHDDIVAVAKVDTDKYPSLGSRFAVEGLPTCIIFKDGKEVCLLSGNETNRETSPRLKHIFSTPATF